MFQPPVIGRSGLNHNRPMGNAQARNTPLAPAPAYGNTTNPNGAQTASRSPAAPPMVGLGRPTMPDPITSMGAVLPPGQTAPLSPPPAAPAYSGGDVVGAAAYYRNAAMQQYQGRTPLASSAQSQTNMGLTNTIGQIDALTQQSQARHPMVPNAPMAGVPDMQAISNARLAPAVAREAARQQNTPMSGFVAAANDPNRYNPMDSQMDARQRSNAAAATAGRTMDRTRGGRQFPAPMAGISEAQMQARRVDAEATAQATAGRGNAAVRAKYDNPDAVAARTRFADAKANRAMEFQEQNDGLNYRQADRLERQRRNIERKVQRGQISRQEGAMQTENAREVAIRRAQSNSGMAGIGNRPAAPDRVRLPDGQLPQATRQRASETAKNLTSPDFRGGSPQFQQEAEVVRTVGLTPDMGWTQAAIQIAQTPFPLQDQEAAKRTASAYRRYWSSMRDSNSEWDQESGFFTPDLDPVYKEMMTELVQTPEDQLDAWIQKYSGHLATFGQGGQP